MKPKKGSACAQCGVLYFEEKRCCPRCDSPMREVPYYVSWKRERVSVILSVGIALNLAFMFAPGFFQQKSSDIAGMVLFAFALPWGFYQLGERFFGINASLRTKTAFPEPERSFSWKQLGIELGVWLGVLLLTVLLIGLTKIGKR